jgi:hypothetical protein
LAQRAPKEEIQPRVRYDNFIENATNDVFKHSSLSSRCSTDARAPPSKHMLSGSSSSSFLIVQNPMRHQINQTTLKSLMGKIQTDHSMTTLPKSREIKSRQPIPHQLKQASKRSANASRLFPAELGREPWCTHCHTMEAMLSGAFACTMRSPIQLKCKTKHQIEVIPSTAG